MLRGAHRRGYGKLVWLREVDDVEGAKESEIATGKENEGKVKLQRGKGRLGREGYRTRTWKGRGE